MKGIIQSVGFTLVLLIAFGCKLPAPEKKEVVAREKHNYIILLDLSDRLVVQDNQAERDKELIKNLYELFEEKVRSDLYIKSGDQIKVVMAPQRGAGLRRDVFEDRLYVNMNSIKKVYRKLNEEERRMDFFANLDTLYNKAVFSKDRKDYYGADIWKYFYEDLPVDYTDEPNTKNYLFILTDGYPIVGHDQNKLLQIKSDFPDLHIVLLEAAPRDKDLEWDRVMSVWQDWFDEMGIKKYTLIKRGSITKEIEQVRDLVQVKPTKLARK